MRIAITLAMGLIAISLTVPVMAAPAPQTQYKGHSQDQRSAGGGTCNQCSGDYNGGGGGGPWQQRQYGGQ
jgi:hypothetical protein